MNGKKGVVSIVVLSLILFTALFLGSIEDKKLNDKNTKEYEEWSSTTKEEKDVDIEPEEAVVQIKPINFYSKLIKKEKVKVLITGDRIALSDGKKSDDGIWSEGVSYIIKKNYGSDVELRLLAQLDISVKEGQVLLSKNDISNNDLIIFCFGHNDSIALTKIDEFKSTYSKIVSELKTKNQNQSLILMIPSTLGNEDKYRGAILAVAKENGLLCVDAKAALDNSGIAKKSLLNGKLPNNLGYQLYTEAISKMINDEVKKQNS